MPAEYVLVDRLLDDPRYFSAFRPFFHPSRGRPSIPMEVYLRMMFLKYRLGIGFELLCDLVRDSVTFQQFCRIGLGEHTPHPSTLEKITVKCGVQTVNELNEALLARAQEAGVVDLDRVRTDTTIVPANVAYPTDSGLLSKGVLKILKLADRIQGSGVAVEVVVTDTSSEVRRLAHQIAVWLRRRTGEAKSEVLAITGQLADHAQTACDQAREILAAVAADEPRVKGLARHVGNLDKTVSALDQIVVQAHRRVGGDMPEGSTRRVSLHDGDARPIRKGSLKKPTEFGYTGQISDNVDGIILDHELEIGNPGDGDRLAPAIRRIKQRFGAAPKAATADRQYGSAKLDRELKELGVEYTAIVRKGKPGKQRREYEQSDRFIELIKWRTGSEGRIATVKRQYGWNRSRMDGIYRTRTWCSWGIFAHNTVKIANLIS